MSNRSRVGHRRGTTCRRYADISACVRIDKATGRSWRCARCWGYSLRWPPAPQIHRTITRPCNRGRFLGRKSPELSQRLRASLLVRYLHGDRRRFLWAHHARTRLANRSIYRHRPPPCQHARQRPNGRLAPQCDAPCSGASARLHRECKFDRRHSAPLCRRPMAASDHFGGYSHRSSAAGANAGRHRTAAICSRTYQPPRHRVATRPAGTARNAAAQARPTGPVARRQGDPHVRRDVPPPHANSSAGGAVFLPIAKPAPPCCVACAHCSRPHPQPHWIRSLPTSWRRPTPRTIPTTTTMPLLSRSCCAPSESEALEPPGGCG